MIRVDRAALGFIVASVALLASSRSAYSQALAFRLSPTMWTEVYTDDWHYDSYIYDVGNKGKRTGRIYVDNTANPDAAHAWI